jgi:tellurite resistance protein
MMEFNTFVLSLARTAAVHFGDVADADGSKQPPDLRAASHIIDVLTLLEVKTRGNLTAEERQVLEQVLFELRLRFVEVQKQP